MEKNALIHVLVVREPESDNRDAVCERLRQCLQFAARHIKFL